MKVVFYIFYNLLLLPVLYSALRFAGIFNKKIRIGIIGRKRVYEELILNASAIDKNKKLVWFHSSSLGEFEQAKPIIEQLKKDKDVNVLITFFSPSGYINSNKYPHADLISYIPFDTKQNAKKFISITNPAIAIIMRYDLWPNIIETLNKRNIPAYLVDATLRENSPRSFPVIKSFHKILYNYLDKILTVSSKDAEEFRKFGIAENKIVIAGDTRFDRVYTRSLSAREKKLISDNIIDNKKVFVAGSTWEQDEDVIFPAFIKLAKFDEKVIMIVAPHEPTVIHLEKIENEFSGKLKTIRFSHLNNYTDEKVIIIDSIGILLTLYTYADVAFVGGSFKQNIHNVLEAAVYGTPVLFGPKIENSQEAIRLAEIGGGIIIKDKRAAYKNLRELFSKDELRTETGLISSEYVKANIGATQKILSMIYPAI
ncbi:MAG: glycosyltransferase N-terminal domain-containing protein [Ignavibacterium sp.]|jgi:3-deoxy-D-manno-octulosonic-acid transferase|nr:3-deoxy-D-manno-octulosonic acid transferase [Ignavibacterium sp.]MDD5607890.1 glycosyltransferase N-terminal domain-containing protein [Ignavibacterium sp.]MDX9712412.1 glycosyltransferase N-terminal domain-containing protein [Ignavibacteriaceae bacterium]MEB2354656.1 3-deoxy-D-manno-octulosonic acid transferase [Ignavibacteriales bacterium]GIK21890.1 MAG: 3-deoxy-D-manno-octulosonic acid transferase [Ignavibacteriota bacterium]